MRCRDGDRVRELISVRQNDDHLRVVAPPSIINVGVRGELRLRIAAQNASEVVYAVGRDGRLPASLDGWRRSDAGRDGAKEALVTIPPSKGRYLIACFAKKGLAQSAVTAAYVQHEDPLYLYTERHAHGLRRLNENDQDGDHACERCGATVEGAGYCCVQGSAFALCRSCALPNGDDQRRLAVDFATGYLDETNATKTKKKDGEDGEKRKDETHDDGWCGPDRSHWSLFALEGDVDGDGGSRERVRFLETFGVALAFLSPTLLVFGVFVVLAVTRSRDFDAAPAAHDFDDPSADHVDAGIAFASAGDMARAARAFAAAARFEPNRTAAWINLAHATLDAPVLPSYCIV